jgi:threonine aldolase
LSINFSSDNVTPASDVVMAAIQAANDGNMSSYGADDYSARLQALANEIFEREVSINPVTTGTAANALALSQLAPPYGAVYCYEAAHIVTDECGAPEFYSGGTKLIGFPAPDGKIEPRQIAAAVSLARDMGVHHVLPSAISITQATEWGTVYTRAELSGLGAAAREFSLSLHMDGARFANALVHLGCSPAEATWKAGVDVLSLGATKNGALCAEAVVFFNPSMAQDFERRRKRAGHLWSKMRFLSAQLLAYLDAGHWLANAGHANAMAARLSQGLNGIPGVRVVHAVDANELFVLMPEVAVAALERQGFKFYRWPLQGAGAGTAIRLVTSYATVPAHVDEFIAAARTCSTPA